MTIGSSVFSCHALHTVVSDQLVQDVVLVVAVPTLHMIIALLWPRYWRHFNNDPSNQTSACYHISHLNSYKQVQLTKLILSDEQFHFTVWLISSTAPQLLISFFSCKHKSPLIVSWVCPPVDQWFVTRVPCSRWQQLSSPVGVWTLSTQHVVQDTDLSTSVTMTVSAESLSLLRKFRSIGVVWAIFSLCYNIIVWVVVIQVRYCHWCCRHNIVLFIKSWPNTFQRFLKWLSWSELILYSMVWCCEIIQQILFRMSGLVTESVTAWDTSRETLDSTHGALEGETDCD